MSQKHENLHFSTFLTLLRSYSIYLVKRQERSLSKSSFSVLWQKENFLLLFAVIVMLNLSINACRGIVGITSWEYCPYPVASHVVTSGVQSEAIAFSNL